MKTENSEDPNRKCRILRDKELHLNRGETMSNLQHGRGDSRSNDGEALPVLSTREGFAMVPLSTGGDGAKLECVDEGLHEGILLTR
jgi:hypothetical protein